MIQRFIKLNWDGDGNRVYDSLSLGTNSTSYRWALDKTGTDPFNPRAPRRRKEILLQCGG